MNTNKYSLILLAMSLLVMQAGTLYADGSDAREVEMKAVYIYKFIQFTQLSASRWAGDRGEELKTVVVGVTDKSLLASFRKMIGNKRVTQYKTSCRIVVKYVDVRQFGDNAEKLMPDVLFIKDTSQYDSRKLLRDTVRNHIMTFGDTEGFLEAGGMVKFVIVDRKLAFEINTGSADQAGIKIRSQLLRLAKKVVDKRIVLKEIEP